MHTYAIALELKKKAFAENSKNIKQAIDIQVKKKALNEKRENAKQPTGIQVTFMFKINLQNYIY